jgi:hypothetical protein
MIEELNKRINNGEPSFVKAAIQPTFGWDTAVGYLTHCADVELGEPIGILNYRLPLADEIDSIKPVKEYLSTNLTKEILGIDMYVTLTTKAETKYTSKNDTLLWNVIGASNFILNGSERTLGPGDLIFIPKNIEYTIKPDTAQCFTLFSLQ